MHACRSWRSKFIPASSLQATLTEPRLWLVEANAGKKLSSIHRTESLAAMLSDVAGCNAEDDSALPPDCPLPLLQSKLAIREQSWRRQSWCCWRCGACLMVRCRRRAEQQLGQAAELQQQRSVDAQISLASKQVVAYTACCLV